MAILYAVLLDGTGYYNTAYSSHAELLDKVGSHSAIEKIGLAQKESLDLCEALNAKRNDDTFDTPYDRERGIKAVIELQAYVGIVEPQDRATRSWDAMRDWEKLATTRAHKSITGSSTLVVTDMVRPKRLGEA